MASTATIVMAGGLGTRMRSARPKVLHELCGRPMLEWVIAAARESGAEEVVVVVAPAIEDAVAERLPDVRLAVQVDARGTGDAVRVGLDALGAGAADEVVVLSGDTPAIRPETVRAIVEARRAGDAAAALVSARLAPPHAYGRVVRGAAGVERIVEASDATPDELALDEFNVGLYCFAAGPLAAAVGRLAPHNAQGELYLTDVVADLGGQGLAVVAVDEPDPASCEGVNTMVELAEREARLNARLLEGWMLRGARIVDPRSTYVDAGVELAADCRIEPSTTLRGTTRVAAGACVGPHVVAHDAEIGRGCTVGPFAYLRPGTVLGEGASVGRFVELKAAHVGPRSKVPHLSYVGDADVAEDVNIGAGTITANYDGFEKHHTRIGARARTSSNSVLVAPVVVGDDAVVAAGSVITEDVPPGALAIARPRQTTKEGYAEHVARRRSST